MLLNTLKIAIKVLMRRKFFTFVSLFGISFTLMILILAVAVFDTMISAVSPESRSDRCLTVHRMRLGSSARPRSSWISSPGYLFLDRHIRPLKDVERVSIHSEQTTVVSYHHQQKRTLNLKRTDGAFWEVMDFAFVQGSPFSVQDEENGHQVAVTTERVGNLFFPNDNAIGKDLELDGQVFRVVGVVKDVSIFRVNVFADVWVPLSTAKTSKYRHELMGGFRASILAYDRSDLTRIKHDIEAELGKIDFPEPARYDQAFVYGDTNIERFVRHITGSMKPDPGVRKFLAMVSGVILLFMLLPALNLINLNVSRIMERAVEIGVRKAFGASSRVLTIQFLIENLVITVIGGVLGFVGALVLLGWLATSGLIPYATFHINYRIFGYGMLLALVFGIVSGVLPAWRMSKQHPVIALKGGQA